MLESLHAIGDALRVVEPVDTDDEAAIQHAFAHAPHRRMAFRLAGNLRKCGRLDTNAETLGPEPVPESLEQTVIAEGLADFLTPQAADEVIDIVFGLEADDIIGSEAAHDGFVHGKRENYVCGRPWDMQEEADAVGNAEIAQFCSQRDEMVVVNPDEVIRLDHRQEMLCKQAIDPEISRHVLARVINKIKPIVAERPE